MPLLDIKNLTVEFKTASGFFRAVDSVSMNVDTGEVLAIVGESGSGKSVSMLAVMGLLPWTAKITADKIDFDGRNLLNITPADRRKITGKDMAMIFQEPMSSLNPCFTVGFQLMEALNTHLDMDKAARRKRAIELLEEVGIPGPETRLSSFPHQLSGGMSQRVMIAMALACKPKLLITHSMGVVAETAERVSVQYAGQKVEEQPVAQLFATPRHPYTAALLAALPERAHARRLPSIPGVVPGQFDRPAGCLFSPRCIYATDLCRTTQPVMDYGALCHYPLGKVAA